jgi:DNA polymerase III subunit delta'
MAERKVYVLGDAERMVMREGSEEAAGAFLKLLEEPPARATIILTSSEPGALIPTIRSRVVAVRVPALGAREAADVLREPAMAEAVVAAGGPKKLDEQLHLANGAPGSLLGNSEWSEALDRARAILDAATSQDRRVQMRAALMQGSSKARGAFSIALDALTTLLHERARSSVERGNLASAAASARALDAVELAKERAAGLTNPALITSRLIRDLEVLSA